MSNRIDSKRRATTGWFDLYQFDLWTRDGRISNFFSSEILEFQRYPRNPFPSEAFGVSLTADIQF